MRTVFDANTISLIIALLIGLAIGWWMFSRRNRSISKSRDEYPVETPQAPGAVAQDRPLRTSPDTPEGNGIVDQGAAATADVAGEVLGVQTHAELPGASGPPDNLAIMKGVGPKFVAMLNQHGIIRFDQLAGLSDNEIAMLDEKMGPFRGRLARDRVADQASYLARGDRDGFEAKFGKLGGS
jgi:predicted flap endonuclease-1-like 5' DNA nuclease